MEYKVGQKFRIRTLEEVAKNRPNDHWNKEFFDKNANKMFTIKEVDDENDYTHSYICGFTEDADSITLNIDNCDDVILKNAINIELDNSLFDL